MLTCLMRFDLLIPKNNEKELLLRAKELGWEKVIFLKEFKSKEEVNQYRETWKDVGLLVKVTSRKDLYIIDKLRNSVDVVVAVSDGSEEVNRIIVEAKKIDYVFGLETASGRDHTHYRRGGVNQVVARFMHENGQKYGMSFSRYLDEEKRALLFGRWKFNAKILKKFKVPVEVFSFTSNVWEVRSADALLAIERLVR